MRKVSQLFPSSVGKKTVMATSGVLLSVFLLIHLAGNSTMFFGRDTFNSYAEHLHGLGFLLRLFEAGLLTVFLLHILLGLLLYIENLRARPVRYIVTKSRGGRTPGSRTMPYTGLLVLVFLLVHLNNFQTIDGVPPSNAVKAVLSQPGYTNFYWLAILSLALHISHGWWSMFQSLGLNNKSYDRLLRIGALIFSIVTGTIFILIPTLALFFSGFLL
jgi:succinate dehydrogenase / fumarate reductase cytochrome b subunit